MYGLYNPQQENKKADSCYSISIIKLSFYYRLIYITQQILMFF